MRWIEENSLLELPTFLLQIGRHVLFPILIAFFAFGGLTSVLQKIWHLFFPPPPTGRYRHAKKLYRSGEHQAALKVWESLKKFGPAYLSRATHALYVELDPQQALGILRVAKERQVKIHLKQVETMKLDAQALQSSGNIVMIDMNARLAKQEHLGVSTW